MAKVPAIRACYAMGHTREDALEKLASVSSMPLDVALERGEQMPADVEIAVPV